MKKFVLGLVMLVVLVGCSTTGGLEDYYKSNFTEYDALLSEECFLKDNEEPKIYYSSDISKDTNFLKSNYYIVLGYSTFNGASENNLEQNIKNLCKQKKAKIALYNDEYTDTRHGVYSTYGGRISSYNIKRYDYTIVLFVNLPDWYIKGIKSGFEVKDLDSNTRQTLQRNTGAIIDVVYNKSNAFYANLIKNDVLIEINGVPIYTADDYYSFMRNNSDEKFNLIVVRNGKEIKISYER